MLAVGNRIREERESRSCRELQRGTRDAEGDGQTKLKGKSAGIDQKTPEEAPVDSRKDLKWGTEKPDAVGSPQEPRRPKGDWRNSLETRVDGSVQVNTSWAKKMGVAGRQRFGRVRVA